MTLLGTAEAALQAALERQLPGQRWQRRDQPREDGRGGDNRNYYNSGSGTGQIREAGEAAGGGALELQGGHTGAGGDPGERAAP